MDSKIVQTVLMNLLAVMDDVINMNLLAGELSNCKCIKKQFKINGLFLYSQVVLIELAFIHRNKRCVVRNFKCNGVDDCGDKSDELYCKN